MRDTALACFIAEYTIQNPTKVIRALRSLPEFTRGTHGSEGELYIWRIPHSKSGGRNAQPVASVWLHGNALRIESVSKPGLRAMQVLIETLVGDQLSAVVEGERLELPVES